MKIKRKIFLSCILVFTVFFSGCQTQTKKEEYKGTIIVGCDDYAPFTYMDTNGHVTGIDVELAKMAFHKMGYKVKFKFIDWQAKKKLLENQKIDCIWSCYTMDGREEEYKWAGPYMKSNQVIAVNMDSDIYTMDDLNGKTIAVQTSTKPEDLFRTHKNVPQFRKVISVQNRDLIYTFLSKGYVDAIAAHDTSIVQFMEDFDLEYRILDEPLLTVGLGVAFDKKTDEDVVNQLNQKLNDMRKDGTIKKIVSKYISNADAYLGGFDE